MRLLDCLIYYAVIGILGFVVGRLLPKKWFVSEWFPYRSFGFEKDGAIYDKLKIKSWQNKAPDMSRILPGLMPAKKIDKSFNSEHLELMLRETCVAEFIHTWLCILGTHTLKIWRGLGGILVFAVYTLLGNLPYILIQRYNRPKLQRLLVKIKQREERKKEVSYASPDTQLQYRRGAQFVCKGD